MNAQAVAIMCVLAALGGIAAFALFDCAPTQTPGAADVSAYAAEQLACVETGASRADVDACRSASKGRWCGKFPSASNCTRGGQP